MNNPQPFTTVHALQLGYNLALRDLEHVDSDTVYHSTKDHVEAYNAATNALTSKDDAV